MGYLLLVEDAPYRSLTVAPREAGMRVDVYLSARFEGWSRSAVARAIRLGEVRSAERALKPSTLLYEGEELRVTVTDFAPTEPPPPCPPILHQDARLLAFDKPPGLLMHPVGRAFAWGLINLARLRFPDEPLHLAHRLDRETSGVVVVARDDDANRFLKAIFKSRDVHKTYKAIVRGRVPWEHRHVDAPIGDDEASPIRLKRAVREDGQPAVTDVTVLARAGDLTLVQCQPRTGRTHQIRVHLDYLGFPILGDRIYGQPPEVFLSFYEGFELEGRDALLGHHRHCLHASALRLPHPDGETLEITAPDPADFISLLNPPQVTDLST
jgi:23S rRNA pseudouridine1911/1915/1917 synthase